MISKHFTGLLIINNQRCVILSTYLIGKPQHYLLSVMYFDKTLTFVSKHSAQIFI